MELIQTICSILFVMSSIVTCLCVVDDEGDSGFVTAMFTKETSIGLEDIRLQKCAEKINGVFQSPAPCAAECRFNCLGVTLDADGSCYSLLPCFDSMDTNTSLPFLFYRKQNPCQHNGTWNMTTDSCQCVDYWVGKRCQRLPKNCLEIKTYGYPLGRHRLTLSLDSYSTPIEVRCNVFDDVANVLLMINAGLFSFNKTWVEYRDGFVYNEYNFWIGLDKMKALNDDGLTSLKLDMGATIDGGRKYLEKGYDGFKLNSDFRFTFEKINDNFPIASPCNDGQLYGDCLSFLTDAKFSTWDNDQDEESTRNCAAEAGVGWWFTDCNMTCNPLGLQLGSDPELMTHMKMPGADCSTNAIVFLYFALK